ncbi:MAG TPA: hypothetical protein VHK70_10650 [Burkholderiaceae bacterium]|nr:hypothetical protein [Burkholderiaceae bacterium]
MKKIKFLRIFSVGNLLAIAACSIPRILGENIAISTGIARSHCSSLDSTSGKQGKIYGDVGWKNTGRKNWNNSFRESGVAMQRQSCHSLPGIIIERHHARRASSSFTD